jgi:hypothetical protein
VLGQYGAYMDVRPLQGKQALANRKGNNTTRHHRSERCPALRVFLSAPAARLKLSTMRQSYTLRDAAFPAGQRRVLVTGRQITPSSSNRSRIIALASGKELRRVNVNICVWVVVSLW